MRLRVNGAGKKRVRGASVIEAGFVFLPLVAVIFLILDLSFAIFVKTNLQNAVRDGVRYAVTGRLVGSHRYLNDSVVQVVQDNALGFLNGSDGACKVSVNYFNPDTGAASTGTQGDLVVVSVSGFSLSPFGPILRNAQPLQFSVSASDIMERCPVAGCTATVNPVPRVCP
jgi:Flp pilus assembly protein TadG